MPSNYPANLDSWPTIGPLLSSTPHSDVHEDLQDAIEAVQTELGTNPAGAFATVNQRAGASEFAMEQMRRTYANEAAMLAVDPAEFVGQRAWVTDLQREYAWTGSHWKIVGGTMPACRLFRNTTFNVSTSGSQLTLGGHSGADGGFRTTNILTIPARLGGIYTLDFGGEFSGGSTMRFSTAVNIAGNTTSIPDTLSPTQLVAAGYYEDGVSTWPVVGLSKQMAFRAGATITLSGSVGVANRGPVMSYISLTMHSHHPEWT